MAHKVILDDLSSLQNETSATNKINENMRRIEAALENTLSRDGTLPNSMRANLDMNSHRILNLPAPLTNTEPVRLIDLTALDSNAEAIGLNSLLLYGAIGNGTTDDTDAVQDAEDSNAAVFVPEGIYDTTLAATSLEGPYWGFGQIRDSSDNLRAPWFSAVTAAPSSFGNHDSINTAFNGDISKVQIAMEHRITGAATLGQPTSGYTYTPEAYAIYGFLRNESGHNESTSANSGRTAAVFARVKGFHTGNGDMVAFNASMFASGTKAGSTVYLANPAISIINGDLTSGAAGIYLNPLEFLLDDAGFDSAAAGLVIRLKRTNATAAKSAWWVGSRIQMETGSTQPGDVAYSTHGSFNFGLDLSNGTYTSNAAITLKANQRIYGNVTVDTNPIGRYPSALTNDWIDYDTSGTSWRIVANNNATVQVTSAQLTVLGDQVITSGLNVGFTSAPVADRVAVGDANFYLDLTTDPILNFDSGNDHLTYLRSSNEFRFRIGGTSALVISAGLISPPSNDSVAIGTTSLSFSDLFLASGAVINFNANDVTITHAANTLTFAGASTGYLFDAAVGLTANDAAALGTATVSWADLFLALGGVINWNNGDVLITHSANLLAFSGATSGYTFDQSITIGATLTSGTGVSTGDVAIELGGARTGNGNVYIDFHATSGSDFECRFLRLGGTDGAASFANTGTGNFTFTQGGVASFIFQTNSTTRLTIDGAGFSTFAGSISRGAPVTKTNDWTHAATENYIISNRAATNTVTLPSAASFPGREIYIKTIQAQTVVSASSNVVPSTSATAGTAILPATDGAWALLVSDGTNWIIMAANPLV